MSIRYFYNIYILGIVILSNGLVSQSSNSEPDFSQLANLNHGDPIVQAIINEKVSNVLVRGEHNIKSKFIFSNFFLAFKA